MEKEVQNSSIVACVRCCGNVYSEPLFINYGKIHIQTHRLMSGIYEVRSWVVMIWGLYTKFLEIASSTYTHESMVLS
jgi:hypothetical protein